eukprot:Seg1064.18 transcript_id=Seg1064.18/GoldUCD/mRNA.D3Y31 product="hypothetical protein" protein_id=Seg1064.18/GoldUCD/D3Y31
MPEMTKLYSDCFKEEPPYVPRKFREENAHKGSHEEIAVYNKLSEHKLSAEIEILRLRAREHEKKLIKIDDNAHELFHSKVQDEDVLKELKSTWEIKAKEDETAIIKRWEKRIKEGKDIFQKDKSNKGKNQKPNTNQNKEKASTTANNGNSANSKSNETPATQPTQPDQEIQFNSTKITKFRISSNPGNRFSYPFRT